MNKLMLKENIKIEEMIFEVRGKQVILSSDVAKQNWDKAYKSND